MYERFQVYRFGFEYPKGCTISFGKHPSRANGYVRMDLAERERIFVSWGQLDSIPPDRESTDDHARVSLSRLGKARDVKEVRLMEHSSVDFNGHPATLTHLQIDSAIPFFSRERNRDVRSIHVHCFDSGRYFILNESCSASDSSEDSLRIFKKLRESFVCH